MHGSGDRGNVVAALATGGAVSVVGASSEELGLARSGVLAGVPRARQEGRARALHGVGRDFRRSGVSCKRSISKRSNTTQRLAAERHRGGRGGGARRQDLRRACIRGGCGGRAGSYSSLAPSG